jgi:hypothetical protein
MYALYGGNNGLGLDLVCSCLAWIPARMASYWLSRQMTKATSTLRRRRPAVARACAAAI